MNSPFNALRYMESDQARLASVMTPYPDYQLDYISFRHTDKHGKKLRKFALRLTKEHTEGKFDLLMAIDLISSARGEDRYINQMRSGLWVLRHNHEIVCVATIYNGFTLNYITTMRDKRGRGYATFLLTRLREFYTEFAYIRASVYLRCLPLFERAGWLRPDDEGNKDDTVNVCPSYAVPLYNQASARPTLELLSRHLERLVLVSGTSSVFALIASF
jgi:hypothetical protein